MNVGVSFTWSYGAGRGIPSGDLTPAVRLLTDVREDRDSRGSPRGVPSPPGGHPARAPSHPPPSSQLVLPYQVGSGEPGGRAAMADRSTAGERVTGLAWTLRICSRPFRSGRSSATWRYRVARQPRQRRHASCPGNPRIPGCAGLTADQSRCYTGFRAFEPGRPSSVRRHGG